MLVKRALVVGLAVAAIVLARDARADDAPDKIACAHSYELAQRLRAAHELRASKEELLTCSRVECPASLRRECVQWLGEVDSQIPTVQLGAKSTDGRAVSSLRILIDGVAIADPLEKGSIPLDPGAHEIRFEAAHAAAVELRVTLKEGERDRRIEATFAPAPQEPSTDVARPVPPPPPPLLVSPPSRPVPKLAYASAITGALALIVGGAFQIDGMSRRSSLYSCEPHCNAGDVNAARTSEWVGNVGLSVGVVAIAAAAILYFTRPEARAE